VDAAGCVRVDRRAFIRYDRQRGHAHNPDKNCFAGLCKDCLATTTPAETATPESATAAETTATTKASTPATAAAAAERAVSAAEAVTAERMIAAAPATAAPSAATARAISGRRAGLRILVGR
jgi:hypothetical protein